MDLYNKTRCVVCYEDLHGTEVVEYKCKHPLHLECMKKWKEYRGHYSSCFICNQDITGEEKINLFFEPKID